MSIKFRCPHCRAILNPSNKIVLRVSRGQTTGLVLLSPTVGDYKVIVPEELHLKNGEAVSCFCPVCGVDLTSQADARFAEILRARPKGGEERVCFHKKHGEHATFIVSKAGVKGFGGDAEKYETVNFFGERTPEF